MPASRLALSLVLIALPGLAGAATPKTPIRPGYWESTNTVSAPSASRTVERRCISRAQVLAFMSGPSNGHYSCTYPTRDIGGGRIELAGQCVDKHGQKVKVSGSGSYTADSFHIDAKVRGKVAGLILAGKATTDAHRLGDSCPADAAR